MISLRQRLNRGLAIILSVIFFAHWLAADAVIHYVAEKQMTTRLEHDGDSLLDTLTQHTTGKINFDSFHIGSVYEQEYSGHYFVVRVGNDIHYSKSLQNFPLKLENVDVGERRLYHLSEGPNHQPLLVLTRSFIEFRQDISISIAEDLTAIDHDINAIRLAYLVLTIFILIIAITLQGNDVKRALRPLDHARQELEDIAKGLREQITAPVPTEIKPLALEINRLLELVVRRLQQSRTAIGNLAHALKTPLAILVRISENPIIAQNTDLQQLLISQTDTIHHYIEKELKRARIAGSHQNHQTFNPFTEISALTQLLKNMYADKQLIFNINAPDVYLKYDREDFLELTGNLLDNACKWCTTTINIAIQFSDALQITVSDDGPGCDALDLAQLTQRGVRLDEMVKGHGLGLAIVQDIVSQYGGSLKMGRSSNLGGLDIIINLPAQ